MEKRRIYQIIFVGLVVLVGLLVISVSLPRRVSITHSLQSKKLLGEVYDGEKVGQTFVAEHNNLSCIELILATFDRKNKGNFFFYLRSGVGSDEDYFKCKVEMQKVKNNEYFRFEFPKIKDSKKKKYYFFIEAPKTKQGNAISILSSFMDFYENGEKIINGKAVHGDLVFKTEYELGWRLSIVKLARRLDVILMFFVNLFQNKVFYFVLFLFGFLWGFITLIQRISLFQKKGGFWAVFGFILVAFLVWIILLFTKNIVVYNQFKNTTPVGEIYGEKKIGQTFIAVYDGLVAVDVLMANYARKITGETIFHIKKEVGDLDDLFQKRVNAERVKDNRYFRYTFPEIEDSKGEKYYFYLEAPEAILGNSLTIWASDEDKYFEGEKIVNGKAAKGDIVFKTVYDVELGKKLLLFLNEIKMAKPFPLNKNWFYFVLLGLLILSCSLLLTYLVKAFTD